MVSPHWKLEQAGREHWWKELGLALELGPAYQGDRLITIELGRASDGKTTAKYEPHVWRPDESISQTAS